jgi:hypothetical protein
MPGRSQDRLPTDPLKARLAKLDKALLSQLRDLDIEVARYRTGVESGALPRIPVIDLLQEDELPAKDMPELDMPNLDVDEGI